MTVSAGDREGLQKATNIACQAFSDCTRGSFDPPADTLEDIKESLQKDSLVRPLLHLEVGGTTDRGLQIALCRLSLWLATARTDRNEAECEAVLRVMGNMEREIRAGSACSARENNTGSADRSDHSREKDLGGCFSHNGDHNSNSNSNSSSNCNTRAQRLCWYDARSQDATHARLGAGRGRNLSQCSTATRSGSVSLKQGGVDIARASFDLESQENSLESQGEHESHFIGVAVWYSLTRLFCNKNYLSSFIAARELYKRGFLAKANLPTSRSREACTFVIQGGQNQAS